MCQAVNIYTPYYMHKVYHIKSIINIVTVSKRLFNRITYFIKYEVYFLSYIKYQIHCCRHIHRSEAHSNRHTHVIRTECVAVVFVYVRLKNLLQNTTRGADKNTTRNRKHLAKQMHAILPVFYKKNMNAGYAKNTKVFYIQRQGVVVVHMKLQNDYRKMVKYTAALHCTT